VLRGLGNGECIFRDLDGRAGRIGVDLISDDLRQSLDTNPTRARPGDVPAGPPVSEPAPPASAAADSVSQPAQSVSEPAQSTSEPAAAAAQPVQPGAGRPA
jgi:hypothetical protein